MELQKTRLHVQFFFYKLRNMHNDACEPRAFLVLCKLHKSELSFHPLPAPFLKVPIEL